MVYTIEEIEKKLTPIMSKYKINKAYLFGSYVREEADENSDIDLIVDTEGSKASSLFSLARLHLELEDVLRKKVDLLTLRSLENSDNEADDIFNSKVNKEMRLLYDGEGLSTIIAN